MDYGSIPYLRLYFLSLEGLFIGFESTFLSSTIISFFYGRICFLPSLLFYISYFLSFCVYVLVYFSGFLISFV